MQIFYIKLFIIYIFIYLIDLLCLLNIYDFGLYKCTKHIQLIYFKSKRKTIGVKLQ